jgi:acetyl esterase/lipase
MKSRRLPYRFSSLAVFTLLLLLLGLWVSPLRAAEPKVIANVGYRENAEPASVTDSNACRLDLYLPGDGEVRAALLWLHGGGLTGGSRDSAATVRIARRLANEGIAVASADYRLNPHVNFPAYIADAAAAYAWLQKNIVAHGGDDRRVFIGGHSAGAYLALMVGLDDAYLRECGVEISTVAGVVAISGQTSTHFTVRAERNLSAERVIVDDAAPLFHVQKRAFPFLILYAGNDMALRVEENRLLAAALRNAGSPRVDDELFSDRDHSTIITKMGEPDDAVARRVIEFILAK